MNLLVQKSALTGLSCDFSILEHSLIQLSGKNKLNCLLGRLQPLTLGFFGKRDLYGRLAVATRIAVILPGTVFRYKVEQSVVKRCTCIREATEKT